MSEAEREQVIRVMIPDTLLSIVRCLNAIDTAGEQTLSTYDRLSAIAEQQGKNILDIALREKESITAEVLAMVLYGLLHAFFEGAAQNAPIARDVVELFDLDGEQESVGILLAAFDATAALAVIHLSEDNVSDEIEAAIGAFTRLTDAMEKSSRWPEASVCAGAICNLIARAGDPRMLGASARALSLACRSGNQRWILEATQRVAVATLAGVENARCSRLDAFDALERILFLLPSAGPDRDAVIDRFVQLLGSAAAAGPAQDAMRGYLFVVKHQMSDPENVDLDLVMQPIVDCDVARWMASLRFLAPMIAMVEDARLSLFGEPSVIQPSAVWETWSVLHPSLFQAVPHGKSLLRERQLDDLLLVLKHEITHVYSMSGYLGLVSAILRAVNLDRESLLWTFAEQGFRRVEISMLAEHGVAPLGRFDPLALFEAEQALEATSKLQILQDVWQPWFEGIAVFTELADDPTADADFSTFASTLLWNLIDESNHRQGADGLEFDVKAARESLERSEQRYQVALQHRGVAHLRHYLSQSLHRHYLAGYLAVRAIVAAWRRTLGKPMTGATASRLLLHLTRYGVAEAIPPLDAQLGTFRSEAARGFLEWTAEVASISQEDLERFVAESGGNVFRWVNGRLLAATASDPALATEFSRTRDRLIDEASRILLGDDGLPSRFPESNADTDAMVGVLVEAMQNKLPSRRIMDAFSTQSLRLLRALPLGSVQAPFWLNRSIPGVFIMLRTTLSGKDTGAPGYDGTLLSLTQEQFDALEQEVRLRRARRMTVTRYADLATNVDANRQSGSNYLAFTCGDFFLVQPRGGRIGQTAVDETFLEDVRLRSANNEIRDVEAREFAKGSSGARRTLRWLTEREPICDVGGSKLDLGPWAEHVAAVAKEFLEAEPRPVQREVSVELLTSVIGDRQRANAVFRRGLEVLFPSRGELDAAVSVLDASGRLPSPLSQGLTPEAAGSLLADQGAGWDVLPLRERQGAQ